MRLQLCLWAAFCATFTFTSLITEASASTGAKRGYAAWVTKVDGDGIAKVRRKAGTESVVGVDQEILPGDRITTDNRSAVELALNDGTIVRVGLNSEYKLEGSDRKGSIVSWVFSLAKGSIRALVEKSPDKKNVKFRVNTPSGTMGVRGTELVLDHNPTTGVTSLYTLEGLVEFGSLRCAKVRSECIDVAAGEKASIRKGDKAPSAIALFTSGELVSGSSDASGGKEAGEAAAGNVAGGNGALAPASNRLALFEDVKKASSRTSSDLEKADDINAMVAGASEALANAQDGLLGRDKSQREAMHAAMADGTYSGYVKIAEKVDDVMSGKPKTAEQREDEATSGTISGKKFDLGKKAVETGKVKEPKKIEDLLTKSASSFKGGSKSANEQLEEAKKLLSKTKGSYKEYVEANKPKPTPKPTPTPQATARPTPTPTASPAPGGGQQGEAVTEEEVQDLGKDKEFTTVYKEYMEYVTMVGDQCQNWSSTTPGVCKWWNIYREPNPIKETTKVARRSGVCYSTKKTCQKVYTPCEMGLGNWCKPKLSEEKCTTKETKVECPK